MYINLEDRKVLIEDIVSGFVPDFILEENPLFLEFLKSYFRSREAFGSDIDIIRNILQYQKIEKLFSIKETTTLSSDTTEFAKTITVASTEGYPSRYGLVQINDEIIAYEYKNDTQFINCSRGFSGATELGKYTDQNTYTFKKTNAQKHSSGDSVKNISILFLKEFLFYLKSKYLPGFENIDFYEGVSEDLVIASIKDFYSSKGTFNSFEILFRILYGADPTVFLPKEKILKPSDSQYVNATELIVEVKSGNVDNIKGSTIFQESNADLGAEESEGVVFDVNFLESIQIPERFFESGTSSQNGNVITIVSNNHGLKSGNSVYIQFSEIAGGGGVSESKVYTQVLVVDNNTFQVFSSVSKVISKQSAKINTLIESSNDIYKIKLSRVDGKFYFAGKTLLRKLLSPNDTTVFVDSTIGFPESGSIEVNDDTVAYTSKSINAFKGCTGVDTAANVGSQVTSSLTVVAYENGDREKPVIMRVVDSTSNKLSNDGIILKNNSRLKIKSIGSVESNYIADSFIQNIPVEYEVAEVDLLSNKLTFKTPHNFLSGDRVDIKDFYIVNENGIRNKNYFTEVLITTNINTPTQIEITQSINPILNGKKVVVSKSLQFGRVSPDFPELNKEQVNVQRVLKDSDHSYYALTSSIPDSLVSLNPRSNSTLKTFRTSDGSLSFGSDDSLRFNTNHNYNSGDKVKFKITGSIKSVEQVAYIKKIDQQTIKLSQSASSVDSNDFIDIDSYKTSAGGSNFTVTLIRNEFDGRTTQDQQLIRQIRTDNSFGNTYDFDKKTYQPFGVLVDGVDLYPPFTDDELNYGKVESITTLDGGTEFDVINGPVGVFTGTVTGVGCSVKIFVEGEIKEVLVTNKGRNIKNVPNIKVVGGNNSDVKLSPVLSEEFISKNFSPAKDVSLVNNTITFSDDHQFETGDKVKYSLVGIGTSIGLGGGGSLVDNSEYFIIGINSTTVKLANTKLESLNGTAIDFGVTLGSGAQKLTSVDPKTILDRIEVVNPGKFKNHEITFSTIIEEYPPTRTYQQLLKGINQESDYIYYRDHGFSTGELIQYTSESTVIGGLVDEDYYYVIKLDDNSFRLAHAGSNIESPSKTNFDDNLFVKITSIPTSTGHVFKIPPITFTVEDSNASVVPTIEPIIRGSIKSVTLDSFGQQYGSQVVNLIRSPRLEISKGTGAIINLIVSNGRIDSAYVASGGSGYFNSPDLIVNPGNSSGKFAKLFAQVSNGVITSVDVISGGSNYDDTSSVTVRTSGSGENFDIQLQKWRVNTIAKNILNANGDFTNNEYYIIPGRDLTNQIVSSYAPKNIRSKFGDNVNGSDSDIAGKTFPHSKIVGWAFDGNPIYAQFGYKNPTSTSEGTKRIKSCYTQVPENVIKNDPNRPNINDYPIGYFINDYFYDNQIGDLDEFNGRYCITPEFPNGTYAYFSTIGANGKPGFPYGIYGLKDRYSSFNLDYVKSNQSYLQDIQDQLITCTSVYSFDNEITEYPFLTNEIGKELLLVQDQNKSILKKLEIIDAGDNYKVDDTIVVENTELFGKNAKGLITSIKGVGINTITTTKTGISTVYFDIRPNFVRAIVGEPHNFVSRDNVRVVIAGINTTNFTFLNDTYPINVVKPTTILVESIPNAGVTTELQISDSVESLQIFVDDFVQIDDEKMKVLRVDNDANQIRVQRNVGGTSIASHTSFSNVNILPSTFEFTTGIQTSLFTQEYNKVYFNTSNAGIGSTTSTTIEFVGIQTQIKVPFKRLYAPSHKFETNQKVTYNFDTVNGIGLTVSDTSDLSQTRTLSDGDELFIIRYDDDYIGLSSERVLLGAGYTATTYDPGFYFPVSMVGDSYDQSLTFNELPVGEASELQTTIDTAKVHGLSLNDKIKLNVKPNFVKEYQLFFDANYNSFKLSNIFVNSGISSVKNTITYNNHGLKTDDRVIYVEETATALGPDFVDGDFYFVKVFSENTFSLGKTKNALSRDDVLNITANSGSYSFSPLDPKITAVRGSKVKFVGIATLPTSLQFFDVNNPKLGTDFDTSSFTFTNDSIEIDTTDIPSEIFIYPKQSGFPLGKSGASIEVTESVYNDEYTVTGISSNNKFNIELFSDPSVLSYGSTNSSPEYTTTSNTALGPINDIKIINRGSLFLFPTGISTAKSDTGTDAIIGYELQKSVEGTNVTRPINSIYDFTSDKTYTLNVDIPSIVSVRSNNKIVGIRVVDPGRGYIEPPKVKIVDQPNIYSVTNLSGNSVGSVNLISKDNGILSDSVTVFADFHTNGVQVTRTTVEADNTSINLFLKEPNNGFIEFPFAVGDEIYVDGITATVDSGTGFNSSDYDFTYFKITGITTTSGSANIRYSIAGVGKTAGTVDTLKSYGRVIKKEDLAKFEALLETSNYTPGETVTSNGGFSGKIAINGWDPENKILSVIEQNGELSTGDILTGAESGAKSIINSVTDYESTIIRNSLSQNSIDIEDGIGNLNDENQVLPDNFYHQSFAYDIISEVSLDKWESQISNINHISGFEKFGTFVVNNDIGIGVSFDEGSTESSILVVNEEVSLDTTYQFDLASENIIDVGEFSISDEITFNSRRITDSIEAKTNRAVLIDDISPYFTGEYDADGGGQFVGLSSFRLTTSESGITTSLFVKYFDSAATTVVSVSDDKITIPSHNFSTGELLEYSVEGGTLISIGSTDKTLAGVTTTKLPSQVFAIRIDDDNIRLAGLSTDAKNDRYFDITAVGSGLQKLTSTTQNTRCMLLIDGIIQTPLTTSDISASIAGFVTSSTETSIPLVGITSINTNSLIQIEDEIIRVGVVGSNTIQNLLQYSERFDNAAWTKNSSFSTSQFANAATAPDGSLTAEKYTNAASGTNNLEQSLAVSAGNYTFSIYLKAATANDVGKYVTIGGHVSSSTHNRVLVQLPAEWTRFTASGTYTAGSYAFGVDGRTSGTFVGISQTREESTFFVWGAQLEEGSTASRYIQSVESFVSRASTATYVDDTTGLITTAAVDTARYEDGKLILEEARTNKVTNNFSTGDNTNGASLSEVTSITNPDGTTGTIKVTATPSGQHAIFVLSVVETTNHSASVFVKKGNHRYVGMSLGGAANNIHCVFDFDTKTVIDDGGRGTYTFVSAGFEEYANGWFRLHVIGFSGGSTIRVFLVEDDQQDGLQLWTASGSEFMYVWGPQKEEGSFPTSYIPTSGSTVTRAADVSTSTPGSASIVTAERGVLGSVAGAHAVGSAATVREGQYIIRDDVVFFDSPPLSGVNTVFNFEQTGIPTSFSRMRFHGRVFSRLSYENNKIFDDISQQFDGTANIFELLSDGNSTEDIFSSNAGILTGTDVSSGVILLNNIFQVPSVDYDLVENVGVGASVQFTGTSAKEDLPKGGKITEFTVERGGGYQPLTRASAIIDTSAGQLSGGSITGLTLVERGSGYREDTLVNIHDSNPGTGATIYALVGVGTYDGNEVNVTNFVYDNNTGLSTITLSGAHGLTTSQIPDVVLSGIAFTCPGGSGITTTIFPDTNRTQFKVLSINSSTEIEVNVGISTIIHTYDSGGTVKPGSNVGLITGFRVDSGGSNYTSGDSLLPIIPSPKSYSQLSLQGGTGSGAVGDLVIIGAGGTTFTFELTDGGIGYRETDVLTISGIPTSPYYSGTHTEFSLTVDNTSRDKFSAFTFGELLLFDDVSSQANGGRVSFSLTRTIDGTKSLVSLDAVDGATFDIRNNLLVFVNDILQIPGVAYQFNGGTRITFTEAPKSNSKITILYYKGSDEDILEIDILETVKKGDLLRLDKYDLLNLGQQNPRRVFDILSADVAETNDYSNVGLGTNPELLRSIDWTKQNKDLIINAEIVYKTRPELISKPIPNTNIIKSITTSDSEIFVDTVKNFEIDSLVETENDLLLVDNSFGQYVGASATITVSEKIVQTISVSAGGSGYYDSPSVSIFSPVPQEKITGITWDGDDNVGIITYTTDTNIGVDPLAVETASVDNGVTVTVEDGSSLSINGVQFIGREFNSIQYSTSDKRYVVVGDNGIVGYSTVTEKINHLVQPAGSELFNEKLNGSAAGVKGYGEVYYIVGDGVVGFASDIKGVYSRIDTAFPPVVGGIVGSSNLDPNTKVSFTDINLRDVKYFDNIDKAVAVGGTIMVNSFADPGEDWQMINIDSTLGGPGGQYLNAITYYNRQDASNPGAPVSAGYVAVGHTNYIFKSHTGTKWNEDGTSLSFQVPTSSLPADALNKNFLGVAANDDEIVVVGTEGLIIRATTLKSNADSWTYVGISTTEDFIDVIRTSNAFVAISTTGKTFTSTQGITWTEQSSELYGIGKTINDFLYVESLDKVVAVGASSGTSALIAESDNSTVVATFTAGVTNGIVTSITINNPGYGYSETNPPIVQVAPPIAKYENIENVKVEGDYGIVVSISTVAGINTDIGIEFELKTDPLLNSSLYDAFSITSSGIETGYYFSITDSIFASSEEFAGVDESNNNIVLSDGLDKIYRASSVVTDTNVGITTVVADINLTEFADLDAVIAAVGSANTEYSQIARYSWGRIYDFDRPNPKSYSIKVGFGSDHNNTGLSSNPVVIRTKQIKENY